MILYGQRVIGLRRHDGYPRWWEIVQHWVIFAVLFELVLPTMLKAFAHTQDPWNVVAIFDSVNDTWSLDRVLERD